MLRVTAAFALLTLAQVPQPRATLDSYALKSSQGPVSSVAAPSTSGGDARLTVSTPSGPRTVWVSPDVPVLDARGNPLRGVNQLGVGQDVRAFFTVDGVGRSHAQEVDVVIPRPAP